MSRKPSNQAAIWSLALVLLAVGCGGARSPSRTPTHDTPVPENVQRFELKLRLSLKQRAGCEEAFDLELYRERGVELIAWREPHGRCRDRRLTVRYLPGRISQEALLSRIRALSVKAELE